MSGMQIQHRRPMGPNRAFVSAYRFREGDLGNSERRLVFPARNAQFWEFYLGNRARVIVDPTIGANPAPASVIVGIQAIGRVELFLSGPVRTFTVMFRPAGFHQLFGVPMEDLAGKGEDSSAVLSGREGELSERLGNAGSFNEMVLIADEFFLPYSIRARDRRDDFQLALRGVVSQIHRDPVGARLDDLVAASGVGARQFQRRFKAHIGVAAKHYIRVARLDYAIQMKEKVPPMSWGQIAAESGYHDQMHLIHDFRALGGEPPSQLLSEILFRNAEQGRPMATMSEFY